MTHLLDTNVCIAAMRGNPALLERMQLASPGDLAISSVTLFELLSGVERSSKPALERVKVMRLADLLQVVSFDAAAAAQTAQLRWTLERIGPKIGPYDTMLAGHAIALDLVLVTHNQREFQRAPGLQLEDWE